MADEDRATIGTMRTVAEVAAVLRVSSMTVYRLIRAGELPALRVGKNYRVREHDLERFLSDGTVRADAPASEDGYADGPRG